MEQRALTFLSNVSFMLRQCLISQLFPSGFVWLEIHFLGSADFVPLSSHGFYPVSTYDATTSLSRLGFTFLYTLDIFVRIHDPLWVIQLLNLPHQLHHRFVPAIAYILLLGQA